MALDVGLPAGRLPRHECARRQSTAISRMRCGSSTCWAAEHQASTRPGCQQRGMHDKGCRPRRPKTPRMVIGEAGAQRGLLGAKQHSATALTANEAQRANESLALVLAFFLRAFAASPPWHPNRRSVSCVRTALPRVAPPAGAGDQKIAQSKQRAGLLAPSRR